MPDGITINLKHFKMFKKGIIPKMEMYLFFFESINSKLTTDVFREEILLNPVY